MKIKKYEKKPNVITVLQFNGENHDEIREFCKMNLGTADGGTVMVIQLPHLEEERICKGDYVAKSDESDKIMVLPEEELLRKYDRAPNYEKDDEDEDEEVEDGK